MSDIEFVFGGSFDPIHCGHINILDSLVNACPTWPIRILPCAVPALKKATSANFIQRVEMLKLATRTVKNVMIDSREVERSGKSYTFDTLVELRKEFPDKQFVVVMGSDNIKTIPLWHKSDQLKELCHLVIVNRPGCSLDSLRECMQAINFEPVANIDELVVNKQGFYFSLPIVERNISSTSIREGYEQNIEKTSQLPLVVQEYINDNLIYQ